MMEDFSFMSWLAAGGIQHWIEAFLINNGKIVVGIIAILKYFATATGKTGENRIIDLLSRVKK